MVTPVVKGRKGFVKGGGRLPNSGRAKGTPNKITRDTKEVMKLLAQDLTPELHDWIVRTSRRSPEKAVSLLLTALEFTQPKLMRTEVTGLDGSSLSVELSTKDSKL